MSEQPSIEQDVATVRQTFHSEDVPADFRDSFDRIVARVVSLTTERDAAVANIEAANENAKHYAGRVVSLTEAAGEVRAAIEPLFDAAGEVDCSKGQARRALKRARAALADVGEGTRVTCPECGEPKDQNHAPFGDFGWLRRSGAPDDLGWTECVAGHTDPTPPKEGSDEPGGRAT